MVFVKILEIKHPLVLVFVGSESHQRTSNSSSFEKIVIKEPQRTIGLHEIGNQETTSSFIEGYLTGSLLFLGV
jgi:hypothetical protein